MSRRGSLHTCTRNVESTRNNKPGRTGSICIWELSFRRRNEVDITDLVSLTACLYIHQLSSVQLLSHVDSLRPQESQHARPPCPSPPPGVHSDSCPSSQWCHPTISSSPSPLALNLSQHQDLFQWVSSLHQVAKVVELQPQDQSFQWIFRVDFLYDWLVGSPCSPRDSQESSPTPHVKSIKSSLPYAIH